MLTKKHKEFPATRMVELEEERKELLEILHKEKAGKEEFAENYGLLAKPEEIDKLFCSMEEPCNPTITLDTNMYLNDRALMDKAEEVAIDVLFCSKETCKQVMLDYKEGLGYKEVPKYNWEKERDERVELMNRPTYFQKVRKYLSEKWLQKINMLQQNLTGQKSN